jgi:hypothetical protein
MIRSFYVPYNLASFPFRGFVERALGASELERLHEDHVYPHFERSTDQGTELHRSFYEMATTSPSWQRMYVRFVANIANVFGEDIVYQRVPTVRFAFPGNVGVGEFHKDSDYNHSEHEASVWVPMTAARDTSAVWCETYPGSEDYKPLNCTYGKALIFDAANLRHGNKDNETGDTRVSFDFRVIPASAYVDGDGSTINTNLPFRLPRFEGERTYFSHFKR